MTPLIEVTNESDYAIQLVFSTNAGGVMTITSHGARCDVCDNYILPLDERERVHSFSIFGIDGLHCDNACKAAILAMDNSKEGFWRDLPEGALRRLAEEIAACP